MSDDPFPGSNADFYERIQVYKAEFQKAKEWNQLCEMQIRNLQEICASQENLIDEVTDFISACRYAGPDGLDTLKKEALNLYMKLPE